MAIYKEIFYDNYQNPNDNLYIRQLGKLENDNSYTVTRKNSETILIFYILQGEMILTFKNQKHILTAKKTYILPNNCEYTLSANYNFKPQMLWINLRGKLLEFYLKQYFDVNKLICANYNIVNDFDKLKNYSAKFENMEYDISLKLYEIILNVKKNLIENKKLEKNITTKIKMEMYIINNLSKPFFVNKMAEDFFISRAQLTRNFKKYFDVSPFTYYNEIRLSLAKSLLINTKLTTEDIATRLNFNSRSHFANQFKNKVNLTPAEYRKKGNI